MTIFFSQDGDRIKAKNKKRSLALHKESQIQTYDYYIRGHCCGASSLILGEPRSPEEAGQSDGSDNRMNP